jgi:hypothetical protein
LKGVDWAVRAAWEDRERKRLAALRDSFERQGRLRDEAHDSGCWCDLCRPPTLFPHDEEELLLNHRRPVVKFASGSSTNAYSRAVSKQATERQMRLAAKARRAGYDAWRARMERESVEGPDQQGLF